MFRTLFYDQNLVMKKRSHIHSVRTYFVYQQFAQTLGYNEALIICAHFHHHRRTEKLAGIR